MYQLDWLYDLRMSIRAIAVCLVVGCGGGGGDDGDDTPPVIDAAIDESTLCDFNKDCTCTTDPECVSGACLGDGTCADGSKILYVARDVTGTTCAVDDKCTLATAVSKVSAAKTIIHLDPLGYHFATGFTLSSSVHVIGRGATVAVDTNNAFSIMGGAVVTLDQLGFGGSVAARPTDAVACTNATLNARGVTIAFTTGIGINASGCTLTVERSTLTDNLGSAMLLGGGGKFTLTNNFIFRNGATNGNASGGIDVLGSVPAGSSVEFNTIVDNHAGPGATNAGGMVCNTAAFTAPNNLFARNDVGGVAIAVNSQIAGACTYPTTIAQADVTGLAFVSPDAAPFNYKIGAGSTAIDFATTVSTIVVDNEGDVRPQGGDKDAGADELKP